MQEDDLWHQLAFVIAALFAGAINVADLRHWADRVIEASDNPPTWLIDVAFFEGFAKDIYRIVPHAPDREFSDTEDAALAGIAFLRGHSPVEVPRHVALHALHNTAEGRAVLAEWDQVFPDLPLSEAN